MERQHHARILLAEHKQQQSGVPSQTQDGQEVCLGADSVTTPSGMAGQMVDHAPLPRLKTRSSVLTPVKLARQRCSSRNKGVIQLLSQPSEGGLWRRDCELAQSQGQAEQGVQEEPLF